MPAADTTQSRNPSQFALLIESGHPAISFHSSSEPVPQDIALLLASEKAESNGEASKSQTRAIPYTLIPEPIRHIFDSDMSSDAAPISASSFAAALTSLTLPTLHAKAAELRNQRAHLDHSNTQLQEFADAGDEDCQDAIRENGVVLRRMQERLELLREEVVDNRGMMWVEEEQVMAIDKDTTDDLGTNDAGGETQSRPDPTMMPNVIDMHTETRNGQSGSLNDEELARRLQERMNETDEGDTDGVHL